MNLSQRDKAFLALGGLVVVFWGMAELVYLPLREKGDTLARVVAAKQAQAVEMTQLLHRLAVLTDSDMSGAVHTRTRAAGFSLFSFLDAQVGQGGLKKNVVYMKPDSMEIENARYRVDTVKIKFNGLMLSELVDFLRRIETAGPPVTVAAFSLVRTGKKPFLLDAVMETKVRVAKE